MNNGLYEHLLVFAAIAQSGSLTGASIATGVGQANISRQLAALERHFRCRLFHRSTRSISLTEQGEALLQRLPRMLDMMNEVEGALRTDSTGLRGRIRIACSHGFARKVLIPALPQWQRLHPDMQVDLVLSDQLSPLIEERIDLAIRVGPLQDSGLIARPLGTFDRIVAASAAYLSTRSKVSRPEDLLRHECVLFLGSDKMDKWQFHGAHGNEVVSVHGRLKLSALDAVHDAVRADLGIAVLPEWFCRHEILDGQFVRLLPGYRVPQRTISAVTVTRPRPGSKVAMYLDYLQEVLIRGQIVHASAEPGIGA